MMVVNASAVALYPGAGRLISPPRHWLFLQKEGIICCTGPGLTEALYILYMYFNHIQHVKCKCLVYSDKWRITTDNDSDKWQTHPLVRESAPHKDKTATVKQQQTSGHEPQTGLDTKTDWLTDRQSQCDSDSGYPKWGFCGFPQSPR
jgi:hypothetical protein